MGEYACSYQYHPQEKASYSKEKWLWQELHVKATLFAGRS